LCVGCADAARTQAHRRSGLQRSTNVKGERHVMQISIICAYYFALTLLDKDLRSVRWPGMAVAPVGRIVYMPISA
jgi:hypothetical protein